MQLIPDNYSVSSAQVDPANDHISVCTTIDEKSKGSPEDTKGVHVFWIDLKALNEGTLLYLVNKSVFQKNRYHTRHTNRRNLKIR